MPAITLVAHLSTTELHSAARACDDADLRTKLEAIRLVSLGWSLTQIGEALGHRRGWVRDQLKRFNEGGVDGLRDRRHTLPGRPAKMSAADFAALKEALQGPSPDGGLWNGRKVRLWIAERLGDATVGKRIGWRYLQRAGFTLQRPQTRHAKADAEQQESFKKKSARSSRRFGKVLPTLRSRSGRRTRRASV